MGNMFGMMKEAAAMQLKMRKIQKELERQTVEETHNGVTVVARGDMTLKSVRLDPQLFVAPKPEQIEKNIVSAVNSTLASAKNKAAAEMAKMTGGLGGLADMLK